MDVSLSVVDGMYGRPAEGIAVELHRVGAGAGLTDTQRITDVMGRASWPGTARRGKYRLEVELDRYFGGFGMTPFQTDVQMGFRVFDDDESVNLLVIITPMSVVTCRLSGDIVPS